MLKVSALNQAQLKTLHSYYLLISQAYLVEIVLVHLLSDFQDSMVLMIFSIYGLIASLFLLGCAIFVADYIEEEV